MNHSVVESAPPVDVAEARGFTLAALFEQSVTRFADRIAVSDDDGHELTYRELGLRSSRLAANLAALGFGRGDRIAIISPPRPQYVETYLALARLGITALTLNTRMHVDELAWCLDSGRPVAVIADGGFADAVGTLRKACPEVREWICLDGIAAGSTVYEDLQQGDGIVDAVFPGPADIHNVLYTSGTTGRPKGAMISQEAAAIRALRLAQWFGLTPDDGFVGWLPLFHCGGDESLYGTLLTGGRFAAFAVTDIEAMFRRIESEKLTWTLLLPGVITAFLDHPRRADHDLSSFRFAIGYANMMPQVVTRLTRELDCDFYDAFGQTETSYVLIHGRSGPGEEPSLRKQACPLVQIRLVDAGMQRVPPGIPGECVVRGPGLMSGYLDNPEATAATFAGGWLHTGDVLVQNSDGSYCFVDRTKYLVKTGGENVYPAEVELTLAAHPAVAEVAVFGVPHPHWGEAIKAVIVLADGASMTADAAVAWCRDRLAGYKRPRFIQFLTSEEIPRSTTGKVQRHVLADIPVDESEAV